MAHKKKFARGLLGKISFHSIKEVHKEEALFVACFLSSCLK